MANLPPGSILLWGSLALLLLPNRWRQGVSIALPVVSLLHLLWSHPAGHVVTSTLFDFELTPVRSDKLSLVWGYVFHLAATLAAIYGYTERSRLHHFCAAAYMGAAIAAVFAGDLLTLFLYWEITAVASVFLVWAGGTQGSVGAGMRYAVLHIGSGVLVLSGALVAYTSTGSLEFGSLDQVGVFQGVEHWGGALLLLGFGIKAAFPLVHTWLPEAYSKATPAGSVVLSAFTTKMAIYALVRGFAGTEALIPIGCIMCLYPLLHAFLADDLRQTLAHVLNNQLGIMVVAIGIGTPLAISGTAAMAFAHVIYKGLLFMAVGVVLTRTGTARQSQLGGLAKAMPWTCGCCLVAAFSVFPLNCGFVTKSLVLSAAAEKHLDAVWLVLVLGAAGAFLTAGLKVPYFIFFHRKQPSHQVQEASRPMLIAMVASAAACVLIGIFPGMLYARLPFEVHEHPYTLSHTVQQMQMLSGVALVFAAMVTWRWYPQPVTGMLLDVDWFYRKPFHNFLRWLHADAQDAEWSWGEKLAASLRRVQMECGQSGRIGRTASTNTMAISAIILLAIYLLVYY